MKWQHKYFKLLLAGLTPIFFTAMVQAQVNGFTVTCPGTTQTSGTGFPVNLSFNWVNATTSATITLNYNPAIVSYNPSCTSLPGCMTVTNNSGTGVLTVNISNLSACTQTQSLSFNVCFQFNCPDTCAGVNKTATFNGTIVDNLSTTQNANCSVTGNTPNNWVLNHYFHSYNSLTAEVTYKAYYYNPTCFRVKNPKFNVALTPGMCGGTITSAWGLNYTYNVSGTTITPNATPAFNQYTWDTLYYVVKLPCNTCTNQTLTSNITLLGDNCNVANSNIKGPVAASYLLPAAPAALPAAVVQKWVVTAPNRFRTRITNTGNTPLNLQHDEYIPQVHISNSPSVIQYTNQPGINNTVVYFNCSNSPGTSYPLVGNSVTNNNAPANTARIRYTINNLLPGNYVDVYSYFDLTSSCSGPAGTPPYKDSSVVTYNCTAPPNNCINCGTGTGTATGVVVYNPQPILQCFNSTFINACRAVGDTLDLCFEFRNVGDAPLNSGQIDVALPNWLQYVPGSATYTGFSPNPTVVPSTNVKFNLPTIPIGNATYKICYKVVINSGAVGGTNWIYIFYTGANAPGNNYFCANGFNICAFAALGVEKKVKGSLDANFGTSGNGVAGSLATYEVTIRNTGTVPVNNLEVIDRIPYPINSPPSDLTILGNPTCSPRGSQFNMALGPTPVVPGATISYSNDPNVCTGWTGVCPTCGPPATGNWSGGNKAIRFLFTPSTTLAPGASITFTFQLQIPANTAAGLHACNTAGFNAKSVTPGYALSAVESAIVCIEVKEKDPPPPGGCCKDLLKNIKEQHSVSNDILNVNLTLAAGPKKLKKVTVSLVQFEVKHPPDCDVCVKDTKQFGNIVPGQNNLPWTTVPANVPFTHMIQWNDTAGKDWSAGIPVNLSVPLPPRSPIACCCDTIDYCFRYTFVDEDCNTCDTIICYRVFNGKDCKESGSGGGGNIECSCSIKPLFQYESAGGQTGSKNITCGDVVNLFSGNIFTSVIPNFQCKDQTGKDCEQGPVTVTIKKPDNTTQVLTGPTYNYTYMGPPGTYEYTIVGTCAGTKCECKFRVVIPDK